MAEIEAFRDDDVELLKHSTATPTVAYCKQRLMHMTHHTCCDIYWNDSVCGVNVIPFTTCVHMQLHISNHMARPPCSPQ